MNDIHTLVSPPRAHGQPGRSGTVPITVAYGDGIGPEIMEASLRVLLAGGADIAPETITIGEQLYLAGNTAGIDPEAWESLGGEAALPSGCGGGGGWGTPAAAGGCWQSA